MSSKKNALDKNRETLKRILKYISQYKWSVILEAGSLKGRKDHTPSGTPGIYRT